MKKSDIAAHVRSRVSLPRAQADAAVNAVFEAIQNALAKGDTVAVTGFGKFWTKSRPARTGRNPRTGETIALAASRALAFKAGKALRNAVDLQQG